MTRNACSDQRARGYQRGAIVLSLILLLGGMAAPARAVFDGLDGDFNADGIVDQRELDLVLENWGSPADPPPFSWTNDLPEGTIDHFELIDVLLNWANAVAPPDGEVGQLRIDHVDPGAALPNHVTNDLFIDFEGKYTGSQLHLTVTEGAVFSFPFGTPFAVPLSDLFFAFPELEYTSFAAQGALVKREPWLDPALGGGAVNVGGDASPEVTSTTISHMWFPLGDQLIVDQSDFVVARVSLSDDAAGSFSFFTSAGEAYKIFLGDIENGQMFVTAVIPEPSTAALACIAAALCLIGSARWRCKRRGT